MKRLGQKICVAVALSLAFVAIWHDSAQAAMPVISSLGQIKDSSVVNPTRIDVDAAGTIYLCDGTLNGVTRYDKYGKALPILKGAYKVKANGVAVTPDGSRVFVSVAGPDGVTASAVAVINGSTGELITYLGSGLNEFKRVVEIDLDAAGNIYVGNFDKAKTISNLVNTAQIDVYNGSTYAKLYSFGGPATNLVNGYYLPLAGEFGEIGGLTVDVVNQEIVVAEGWNNNGITRAQVFSLNGTLKRVLTEAEVSGTQMNCKPVGLTVDPSGRFYMLSILTSTVHFFTTNPVAYLGFYTKGTPDPAYDSYGNVIPWTAGMIPTPSYDTVYDPSTNRLFVVTDGNGIQIFSVDGSTNPIKINSAPQTPVLLSPVQDSTVATLTPTLQWTAPFDADNDPLTYNVKITTLGGDTVTIKENIATTSLTVAAGLLLENNSYRWQVQAADAVSTSSYSALENFRVNAIAEAPTAPVVIAPAAAATVDKDTIFSWHAATDADPHASLTYRLEISKNEDLTAPIITVEQSALSTAAFSTIAGYADLQPGETYHWRVVAVDNTGLTAASAVRSMTYTATILKVDATIPEAKVYIGGNGAYSGRYVGEVPVELRDITPGTIEVVVERAGYEPWVKAVVVAAKQIVAVNAPLVAAILPGEFERSALFAAGLKIQGGADAAPVLVDFDSDGLNDLLVADASGKLIFYQGTVGADWLLSGVQLSDVTLPSGAVPFVADWNNDHRKDLLVGAADGSVVLYLNSGTQEAPVFSAATPLLADNAPLSVVSNAAPLLFDLNNDGKKDLLVGSGNGTLYSYLNIGSDEAPLLAARTVLIAPAAEASNASALVTDWDADGSKEILLTSNQEIALYKQQADGSYVKGAPLLIHPSFFVSSNATTYELQSSSFGQKIRMITANTDGLYGKDLIIGNAAGEILQALSTTGRVDAALKKTLTVVAAGSGRGTVTSDVAGINCGSDCSEDYKFAATVILTAKADSNNVFAGWSGACTGTGPCEVSIAENASVTATFAVLSAVGPIAGIYAPATNSTGSYQISWNKSATAGVTYELTENGIVIYRGDNNYFNVTSNSAGTYNYSVKATRDGFADSASKGPISTSVALAVSPIAGIYAPATNSTGSYQVSWNKSATPDVTYILTENNQVIYTGLNNYFNVTGRVLGSYSYSVKATKAAHADSELKGPITTSVAPAVGPIAGIYTPATNSTGSYQVSWNKSATADVTYILTENNQVIYTGLNNYFNVTGKGAGDYSYSVMAKKDAHADSDTKGPVTTRVALAVGPIAGIYTPVSNTTGSYQVSWNKSATAGVTYILKENDEVIYEGVNNYFNVTKGVNGSYSYSVQAIKVDHDPSAVKGPVSTSVTLTCGPIAGIYAPATNSTGSYQISWNKSATAGVTYILTENGSEIYRGTNNYFNVAGKPNGTYNYSVKASRDGYVDSAVKGPVTTSVTR